MILYLSLKIFQVINKKNYRSKDSWHKDRTTNYIYKLLQVYQLYNIIEKREKPESINGKNRFRYQCVKFFDIMKVFFRIIK